MMHAAPQLEITVYEGQTPCWSGRGAMPIEVGRQQDGDVSPLEIRDLGSVRRLVIAPIGARGIPRLAMRIEAGGDGKFRVTNVHPKIAFLIGQEGTTLQPGQSREVAREEIVLLPENRALRLAALAPLSPPPAATMMHTYQAEDVAYRSMTRPPSVSSIDLVSARLGGVLEESAAEQRGQAAVDLVRSALTVIRQAAGSDGFFDAAVQSVATMIELDRAMLLMREGNQWMIRAAFENEDQPTHSLQLRGSLASFSSSLLERLQQTKSTVVYDPSHSFQTAKSSMMALDRAVASPILDENEQVIGALYGDRKFGSARKDAAIGDLEAALLEVMAGAVSAGLARQRQEAIRASLSQFFSPEVAARLEANNDLLTGRDAEVSVLFCDVRGFSTIAERAGAEKTIAWINDVLTDLSQCVLRNDGVLVDYVGDELMAMWGAPGEQPDHALRACRAACEMLACIEPLRDRWQEWMPEGFGIGIGINTGAARVGNTGSRVKFKYGPLGNTVNLASRVQSMTRKLGVAALITQSTAHAVRACFPCRRLATVRPLGINEPTAVYQLHPRDDEAWRNLTQRYEEALTAFEAGDSRGAAWRLASLVHEHPGDHPSLVLLGRTVECLTGRVKVLDPVWTLDSK